MVLDIIADKTATIVFRWYFNQPARLFHFADR